MTQKILPSIMAKNQAELNQVLKKLKNTVKELHLDVVDGKFAPNQALNFDFELSSDFKYNIHLMVKDSDKWVDFCLGKKQIQLIIFHPEVFTDDKGGKNKKIKEEKITKLIKKIKNKNKKVGLALKPETKVSEIKGFLNQLDYVLVLTVHPGFYGAEFLPNELKKVIEVKKLNPKIKVIVDGGMHPTTIQKAAKAQADYFVSGSYVTKADKPKIRIKKLIKKIKE